MLSYELTEDTEFDLRNIAEYTLANHGAAQMKSYMTKLDKCAEYTARGIGNFKEIKVRGKAIRIKHCQHHYIFGLIRGENLPMLFLAVLHERMDLMKRLKKRMT